MFTYFCISKQAGATLCYRLMQLIYLSSKLEHILAEKNKMFVLIE